MYVIQNRFFNISKMKLELNGLFYRECFAVSVDVTSSDVQPEPAPFPTIDSEPDLPDYYGLVYAAYERDKFYLRAASRKRRAEKSSPSNDEFATLSLAIPRGTMEQSAKTAKLTPYGCAAGLADPPFLLDAEFRLDATAVPLPDICKLLNALVSAKAADGFDLERLEVIGDSFLKLASYIHMFLRFPQHQEGRLTQLCDNQVCFFGLLNFWLTMGPVFHDGYFFHFIRLIHWFGSSVHWLIKLSIYWLIHWLIDWLIDWSFDWLIDWVSEWMIDRLIDWLNWNELKFLVCKNALFSVQSF